MGVQIEEILARVASLEAKTRAHEMLLEGLMAAIPELHRAEVVLGEIHATAFQTLLAEGAAGSEYQRTLSELERLHEMLRAYVRGHRAARAARSRRQSTPR